jgi:cAMP phosphodiesterase
MKKLPKLIKKDIVCVEWEDTNVPLTAGWMTDVEHGAWVKECGSKVRSVGIYISQNKDFISLVGDTEADECESPSYLRPINIGKGFIKSIEILKRGKL